MQCLEYGLYHKRIDFGTHRKTQIKIDQSEFNEKIRLKGLSVLNC